MKLKFNMLVIAASFVLPLAAQAQSQNCGNRELVVEF